MIFINTFNPYKLLLLFTIVMSCNLSQKKNIEVTDVLSETDVRIDTTLYDLGIINQNSKANITFKIQNIGGYNLLLKNVSTDCHCTVARWDSLPVAPGQVAKVIVTFDTKDIGFFQQSVNINMNTIQKNYSCLIRGRVVSSLKN